MEREREVSQMSGLLIRLNELREQGEMTWSDRHHAWIGNPEAIFRALASDGYEECQRAIATSHPDGHPAGGVWRGVNRRTGSIVAAIWASRRAADALVFLQIDGEAVTRPGREAGEEEGGEA